LFAFYANWRRASFAKDGAIVPKKEMPMAAFRRAALRPMPKAGTTRNCSLDWLAAYYNPSNS
jgi:hypothetical protein